MGVSHQSPQILPHSISRQVASQFSNWQPQKVSHERKISLLPALYLMIGYWGRERSWAEFLLQPSGKRPPRTRKNDVFSIQQYGEPLQVNSSAYIFRNKLNALRETLNNSRILLCDHRHIKAVLDGLNGLMDLY